MAPDPPRDPRPASGKAAGQKAESSAETTNQATELYQLAKAHYRLIRTDEGIAYGVRRDGPNIAIEIGRGGVFGNHLIRLYYESAGKAPSDDAEKQATKIMLAYLDEQNPEPAHLRAARHGNGIVVDLGTPDGSCVIVTADGWRIEERSPVVFRRGAGLALPYPQRDHDGLAKLWRLVNATEEQFRLAVGWLVAALIPGRGYPILLLRGEQGSAKSSMARILQQVIDPSGMKPGALPKDERDFAVRMHGAHVQAFDNVSYVPPWLSDALCRAATGDTFVTRALWTDLGRTVIRYERPLILNTIDAGALSGDLVERGIPLDLLRISPENRRAERALLGDDPEKNPGFWDEFDKHHAVIFGAILDLVAAVFRNAPGVAAGSLPRMADFGRVLAALDAAQNWDTGRLFAELVDSETGSLVENHPFGAAVLAFMDGREEWHGTTTQLLAEVSGQLDRDRPPPKGWPGGVPQASGQLRRMAPSLRVHNIDVDQDRTGKSGTRTWFLWKRPSAPSAPSATHNDQPEQADGTADDRASADGAADGADGWRTLPPEVASAGTAQASGQFRGSADGADSADGDSWVRDAPADLDDPQAREHRVTPGADPADADAPRTERHRPTPLDIPPRKGGRQ